MTDENDNKSKLLTSTHQMFGAMFTPVSMVTATTPAEAEVVFDEVKLTEEDEAGLDADICLSPEAQAYLDVIERRIEQGLTHHPFPDGITSGLIRLGNDGNPYNPSIKEITREVSGWFVKKDNKFYDVNNLQVSYTAQDLKQVIVNRTKVLFPNLDLTKKDLGDFFRVLLDPPMTNANPEENVAVWSGHTTCIPANNQKIFFKDGVVSINIWQTPNYRRVVGVKGTALDDFLNYIIPVEAERAVFLDWLAWSLKHEEQKPRWAIMLYSQKQGTGKTVLTDLMKDLFGVANTSRINGVRQLVARFNKEVLQHKLVVVEEIELRKGSKEANQVKSLITEDSTTVEAKGLPSSVEDINCAFVMTSNHLPTWLEEADRRFYILNFNHEGYNNGGKDYDKFVGLVKNLKEQTNTEAGIKGIYDDLMARDLTNHNAMSLNVMKHSTGIMKELQLLSPDVVKVELQEILEANNIVLFTTKQAKKLIELFANREANAQTHLFTELGYKKQRFAWGGNKSQRACWYKPSADPERGEVLVGGIRAPIAHQINKVDGLLGSVNGEVTETSYTQGGKREW